MCGLAGQKSLIFAAARLSYHFMQEKAIVFQANLIFIHIMHASNAKSADRPSLAACRARKSRLSGRGGLALTWSFCMQGAQDMLRIRARHVDARHPFRLVEHGVGIDLTDEGKPALV